MLRLALGPRQGQSAAASRLDSSRFFLPSLLRRQPPNRGGRENILRGFRRGFVYQYPIPTIDNVHDLSIMLHTGDVTLAASRKIENVTL
jgi:hypothetical protein